MYRQVERVAPGRALRVLIVLGMLGMSGYAIHELTQPTPPEVAAVAPQGYLTASGREVTLTAYQGRYLWVDHAAAWCSYCAPQTTTIIDVQRRYPGRLDFLTVVTGTDRVMQPPTAATARQWASRFGLDPERVLARFATDTLPYHVLYSPQGEVLHRGSGLYDAPRIVAILRANGVL